MYQEDQECRKCGGTTFGEGKLTGYANVQPTSTIFSTGSPLLLSICVRCGEVYSMRVQHPEKFKKK